MPHIRVRSLGSPLPAPAPLRPAAVLPPAVSSLPAPAVLPRSQPPSVRSRVPSPSDTRARTRAAHQAYAGILALMASLDSLRDALVLDQSLDPLDRVYQAFGAVSWKRAQATVAQVLDLVERGFVLAEEPSLITPVRHVNDLLTRTEAALANELAGITRMAEGRIEAAPALGTLLTSPAIDRLRREGMSKWQARANLIGRALDLVRQVKADLRTAVD